MCKILIMAGIKKETSVNAWKFAKAMAKPMSYANTDGLGYSAITADGKLFGERWLTNGDAFAEDLPVPKLNPLDEAMFSVLADAIDGKLPELPAPRTFGEYNYYGEVDRSKAVAITLHTRMATTPKGMLNTHPFTDDDVTVSLIHNGIIRNADDLGLNYSTCDSESILIQYMKKDVKSDPNNFQEVATALEGYYACGVLTNTENGPILDVFKGNTASLYAAYIKELDIFVLSTSDTDIKNVCKDLGFTMGDAWKIMEGKFIRVNAITSKTISITPFKVGQSWKTTQHFPHNSHSSKTLTTGTGDGTGTIIDASRGNVQVYPFGRRKTNTPIPSADMHYFKQGKFSCVALTEHEVQEEIMNHERQFAGGRY